MTVSGPAVPDTCGSCGSRLVPGDAFCRGCGTPNDAPAAVETGTRRLSPAALVDALHALVSRLAQRPALELVGGAVVVLAVVALVVILRGSGSDGDDIAASDPAGTIVQPPRSDQPQPPAVPGAAAETAPRVVNARVVRTCGKSGTDDCFVSIRRRPTARSAEVRRLREGASVRVICQRFGGRAASSVLRRTSRIWSRTTDGGYLTNVYLTGPRLLPSRMTLPRCR